MTFNEANVPDNIHGQFFYKSPQYLLKVPAPVQGTQGFLRITYEGPKNSYNAVILVPTELNKRIVTLTPEIASVDSLLIIGRKLQTTTCLCRIEYSMQHSLQCNTVKLLENNDRSI